MLRDLIVRTVLVALAVSAGRRAAVASIIEISRFRIHQRIKKRMDATD